MRTTPKTQKEVEVAALAATLMSRWGLTAPAWVFGFNHFALCWHPSSLRPGRIEVSEHHMLLQNPEQAMAQPGKKHV
jgi:hypothetical protein